MRSKGGKQGLIFSSFSAASTTSAATSSETSAPSSANAIASPMALIFLTITALIYLN
jgi:hypothetical protein